MNYNFIIFNFVFRNEDIPIIGNNNNIIPKEIHAEEEEFHKQSMKYFTQIIYNYVNFLN